MNIVIEPKFRDLIPPLTDEEFSELEQDVKKNGIRDSLKVWKGRNILVDGHHRYKLAQKYNLEYKVDEIEFTSEEEAVWWMVKNQTERRNLNKTQQALLYADAEDLVSSIKAEARKKKSEDGKRTGALAHKAKGEGFPNVGKTLNSYEQPSVVVSPQADVPIQVLCMPEPRQDTLKSHGMDEPKNTTGLQSFGSEATTPQAQLTLREHAHFGQTMMGNEPPQSDQKPKSIHVNKILAEKAGVSHGTMDKVMAVKDHGDSELIEKMRSGDITANKAYNMIRREKKAEEVKKAQSYIESQNGEGSSVLYVEDSIGRTVECDLLLTDPPYSTDVPDIEEFVDQWLYAALDGVKSDGFAYVFIGAYPNELAAYLTAEIPDHLELEQVLVWTYKNTLGNNPKGRYKQNWQACLFYRGVDAPDLDCPLTNEQWAVQEVNAPDGRQGDRFHAWQKPLELCERFIRHTTKKGDTVYDPFACTGTTLVAAAKLGRNGIGYEINRDNAEIAFGRGVTHG